MVVKQMLYSCAIKKQQMSNNRRVDCVSDTNLDDGWVEAVEVKQQNKLVVEALLGFKHETSRVLRLLASRPCGCFLARLHLIIVIVWLGFHNLQ